MIDLSKPMGLGDRIEEMLKDVPFKGTVELLRESVWNDSSFRSIVSKYGKRVGKDFSVCAAQDWYVIVRVK